jgi:hypothetical protein
MRSLGRSAGRFGIKRRAWASGKKEQAKKKKEQHSNNKEPPATTQKICVRNERHLGHERNVLLETDLSQERYRAENAGSRLHPIGSLFGF